jgi:hypothetical protein
MTKLPFPFSSRVLPAMGALSITLLASCVSPDSTEATESAQSAVTGTPFRAYLASHTKPASVCPL